MKQNLSFSESIAQWIEQFDQAALCAALLTHCDEQAVYLLDKNQRVLHWSTGAEKFSGFKSSDLIGKPCFPGYEIVDADGASQQQHLTLTCADRQKYHVQKTVYVLRDNTGLFAGGLGVLMPCPPQTDDALPKITNAPKQNFHGILSRSPAMRAVFQVIENAAETTATVLVRGESGSGKELVARAIHQLSARHDAPFLAINCAALSSSLLESELFGHVRGAFTGAIRDHSGLFLRAHGGTLFLDEVAELPLELQAKLLRVIQERNYIPVGGDRSIAVDVRIVAATHRSLREQVKKGEFREDLMYRLRVVPIFIPPLRERREDISLLLWHFIQMHNAESLNKTSVRRIEKIDPSAMQILLDYPWPGNVRELHNVIEYAFAVGRGTVLRCNELPPEFRESHVNEPPIRQQGAPVSADQEAAAIRSVLEQCNGMIAPAARLLGMSRATFWRKRKHYGI